MQIHPEHRLNKLSSVGKRRCKLRPSLACILNLVNFWSHKRRAKNKTV